jgi:hypothetical protein
MTTLQDDSYLPYKAMAEVTVARDFYEAGILSLSEYLEKVNEVRGKVGMRPLTMSEFNPLKILPERRTCA